MGKSLLANELSFTTKIIRVYLDQSGQPLHISHTLKVVVRRPDRLAVLSNGDDGGTICSTTAVGFRQIVPEWSYCIGGPPPGPHWAAVCRVSRLAAACRVPRWVVVCRVRR